MARVGRGTEGDAETVQLLQMLPADLQARGWMLLVAETRGIESVNGFQFRAVYSRPFDTFLDTDYGSGSGAIYDKTTRQRVVRISTLKDRSLSWQDAHQDGIRRMREADAKRHRRR